MPVGQQQASLNIPSPSELAGGQMTPAVTPSAVTQMSEALRQGFLTADEIIARTGKRAQLKEKADVMALQQQMSPETLAAQDVMRRAAVTKAQGSIDVAPGEVARAQAENKMAADIAEAGVGFSDVAKNLSSQGQQIPRTPEGKIDVSAAFAESANIDRFRAAQSAAIANKPEKQTVTLASGAQQSVDWDKLTNRQMSPAEANARYAALGKVSNYNVWKSSDLFGPQPGQVAAPQDAPPAPMVEPKAPVDTGKLRAEMINAGRLDIGAGLSDEALLEQFPQTELVTPKTAPVAAKPDVMPATVAPELSGVGSSVIKEAPTEKTASGTRHLTEIQSRALSEAVRDAEANPVFNTLEKQGFDPSRLDTAARVWAGGATEGARVALGVAQAVSDKFLPKKLELQFQLTPDESNYGAARESWITGILRKESGAAIGEEERKRYISQFFPSAGDSQQTMDQKKIRRGAVASAAREVVNGVMTPAGYEQFWTNIAAQSSANTAAPSAGQPAATTPGSKPTRVPAKDAAGNVVPGYWIEQ